jgi:glutamine amidotransferase
MSSSKPKEISDILKLFYENSSTKHAHGWGIGIYQNKTPFYFKEPIQAINSEFCKDLTNNKIVTSLGIAHIRYATRGNLNLENTHPFFKTEDSTSWIFAHNGTVDFPKWTFNKSDLKGDTDSEKIFLHILNRINECSKNTDTKDKFTLIAKVLEELSPYGKMNLSFTDGENLYVHTNLEKTLYSTKSEGTVMFATEPLDIKNTKWNQVALDTLLVYKDGQEIFRKELKPNKLLALTTKSNIKNTKSNIKNTKSEPELINS